MEAKNATINPLFILFIYLFLHTLCLHFYLHYKDHSFCINESLVII